MPFERVATEIVAHIFLSCSSISDVLALASTCRRFHHIFASSQRLAILEHAAEQEYGPLEDLTQLLTYNASQPAHIIRDAPFSLAMLQQIIHAGRVAERWCDIYPFKKWKYNFESRRLLTIDERYRLRRALYRLWLYSCAFHNKDNPREIRMVKLVIQKRATLLHNWSTTELAEMADIHAVLREVLHSNICPSNGTIARKFTKRFPDAESHLLFNIHLNYPPIAMSPFQSQYHSSPNILSNHFHSTSAFNDRYRYYKYRATSHYEPGSEGWGDDIPHYYVVEDMLKLDPEQILWLKGNAPLKGQVETYTRSLGEWFENNGETWSETLTWVLSERGEDVSEVLGAVAEGHLGIAS